MYYEYLLANAYSSIYRYKVIHKKFWLTISFNHKMLFGKEIAQMYFFIVFRSEELFVYAFSKTYCEAKEKKVYCIDCYLCLL